jgi:hypothetical protein
MRVPKIITPIRRTPVPNKTLGLIRGDIVEILVKDRTLECAYPRQTGKVVGLENGRFLVVLKCGHLWAFRKDHLKKIGHEDQLVGLRKGAANGCRRV